MPLPTSLRFRGNNKGFVEIQGTGGVITNAAGYRYHTFIGNGTFTMVTRGTVEYIVVGGGGGGGALADFPGGSGIGGAVVQLFKKKTSLKPATILFL